MATQFKYIKSDNTEGMVTASSAEEAMKTAPDRLATSGVQAIPQAPTAPVIPVDSAMGAVQPLPQVDNRPLPTATTGSVQGAITTAAMPPVEPVKEDTTARGKMESLASKIFGGGQDVAAEREQLRIDAQTREKEAQARLLGNKLTARQRDIQKGLEAIEANPRGQTEYALNAEINKYNRETARELADLSFSYNVALGDYQAAEKIVSERLSDIQAQRSQDIQAFNTLFNFVQNDMTESEKLQAQQAFQEKQNETNFEQQQELARLNSTLSIERATEESKLKQSDPLYQAQLAKAQADLATGGVSWTERAKIFDLAEKGDPEAIRQIGFDPKSKPGLSNMARAATTVVRDANDALYLLGDVEVTPSDAVKGIKPIMFQGGGVQGANARLAAAKIPGTATYNLNALISSVKSNIGIDTLLNIKREGSGLGQVPQSQLETLQEMLGQLDIAREPELLKRDINDILKMYQDIVNIETRGAIQENVQTMSNEDLLSSFIGPANKPQDNASFFGSF